MSAEFNKRIHVNVETFLFIFFGDQRNVEEEEQRLADLLSSAIVVHDKLQSAHPIGVCITVIYETRKDYLVRQPEKLATSSIKLLGLSKEVEKELWNVNIRTFERLCGLKANDLPAYGVRRKEAPREIRKKLKEWGLTLGTDELSDL